jgi:hypothetical protein
MAQSVANTAGLGELNTRQAAGSVGGPPDAAEVGCVGKP